MGGMDIKTHLKSQFTKAGIPIKLTESGFVRGLRDAQNVSQIDIDRTRRGEQILCYVGEGSEMRVLNVDRKLNQVVLSVVEPERRFREKRSLPWGQRDPDTGKRYRWEERVTPRDERRLLIGMDERHLFVAQIDGGERRKATTVRDAHTQLAPAGIPGTDRERKKKGIKRQGEWFFLPTTAQERQEIASAIKVIGVQKKVPVGPSGRGRSHVIDERVVVLRPDGSTRPVFARGRLRHPDHRTLKLQEWHRVLMNTEDRSVEATWVD
jgi:hypothetical protein